MVEKEKGLTDNLTQLILALEVDTKTYLDSFDVKDMIILSADEAIRKKHLKNYKDFSVKLKKHIEGFENNIASLSLLICEADNLSDKELTQSLIKKFDNYSLFFVSVTKFINNCEAVFLDKNTTFRQSLIIGYTRELFISIQSYKNSL